MVNRFWRETQQVLVYRFKGEAEIRQLICETLDVRATPIEWDAAGKPIRFHVEVIINRDIVIAIHDETDYHEFIVVEV